MSSYQPNTHFKPSDDLHHGSFQVFEKVWKEFLSDYKDKFKGNVLDVGCGDGYITEYCKQKLLNPGIKMLGCDLSEKMVEFCKQQRPGIDFFQLDITVDIDDKLMNKYDGILLNLILHFIPEPRKTLENLYKLLDKDGFFSCSFFPTLFIFETYKELLKQRHPEWSQHVQEYKSFMTPFQELKPLEYEAKIQEMMTGVGFKNVQTKILKADMVLSSLDTFKGLLRSTDPFYPRIEESKAERYLDNVTHIWIDRNELRPLDPEKPILNHPELPVYSRMTVLAVTADK